MTADLARMAAVQGVIARLAHTIDTRRWDEARALLADEVTTDYTSLFGGEVQRQRGEDLVAAWRRLLEPLEATQHLVGAIDVQLDGAGARAECHVRGYHLRQGTPGGDEWMVAGQWIFRFVEQAGEWRISALTLRTFYQTGNSQLLFAST